MAVQTCAFIEIYAARKCRENPLKNPSPLMHQFQMFEDIRRALADLTGRHDEGVRWETVELRRKLAQQIAALRNAAEQDARVTSDSSVSKVFREKFAAMRAATAIHQANWPVVTADPNNPVFIKSASNVMQTQKSFSEWFQDTIRD
jgi:hypothetical protein